MCGRFTLTESRYDLENFFDVKPDHVQLMNGHINRATTFPHRSEYQVHQLGKMAKDNSTSTVGVSYHRGWKTSQASNRPQATPGQSQLPTGRCTELPFVVGAF